MLRSYEQIWSAAPAANLIVADEFRAVLADRGASYRTPWHWHDCLMILMPNRGAIDFKDETRRKGTWLTEERFVVVPKLHAHETKAPSGTHDHVALYLTDAMMSRMEGQFGSFSRLRDRAAKSSVFAVTPELRMLQKLCCAGGAGDPVTAAAQAHLATALLISVLGRVEKTDSLPDATTYSYGEGIVRDVQLFIDMHFAEQLTLDDIAATFKLSRRHLTRLFRQLTGLSIAEYQEQKRIKLARELLIETTLPVGEICWRAGFDNGSALAKAMRRVTGHSPTEFRKGGLKEHTRLDK